MRGDFISPDPPVAKNYLTAMVEGLQLYRQNNNYAIQVLKNIPSRLARRVCSRRMDYLAKNTPVIPLTDAEAIQPALASDQPSNRKAEDF